MCFLFTHTYPYFSMPINLELLIKITYQITLFKFPARPRRKIILISRYYEFKSTVIFNNMQVPFGLQREESISP